MRVRETAEGNAYSRRAKSYGAFHQGESGPYRLRYAKPQPDDLQGYDCGRGRPGVADQRRTGRRNQRPRGSCTENLRAVAFPQLAGIGAEFAARFQEDMYDELDGPITRIAALDVPMPYNLTMEHSVIPSVDRIVNDIRAMM